MTVDMVSERGAGKTHDISKNMSVVRVCYLTISSKEYRATFHNKHCLFFCSVRMDVQQRNNFNINHWMALTALGMIQTYAFLQPR